MIPQIVGKPFGRCLAAFSTAVAFGPVQACMYKSCKIALPKSSVDLRKRKQRLACSSRLGQKEGTSCHFTA